MNAFGLGLEAANQLIVLDKRAEPSFFAAPVTIMAGCGARRAKDQVAMRIGRNGIGGLSEKAGAVTQSYETAYEERTDHQDGPTHRASVPAATYFGMPI
jgi:hypothetical protein